MKICPKCNKHCDDNTSFCPECGAPLPQQQYGGAYDHVRPGNPSASQFGITPRSIPLCVIFSIFTCGIYAIYWMIKLNFEDDEK